MPTSFTIDPGRRVVIFRVSEVMTIAGVEATRQEVKNAPLFDPTYDQVVDIRDVTEVRAGRQQIWKSADQSVFSPKSRIAVVVTRDHLLIFGLARMYELIRNAVDPGRVRLFGSVEDAEAWLARP
jgi:hypothetical protein